MKKNIKSRNKLIYCQVCNIKYLQNKCPMCKLRVDMQNKINELKEDIDGLYRDMAGESI
ncbi:MAG: hypothetical protein J7L15_08900 [Clostridiales bacterium]|nr:hypothetical protein [Clostridiales bacterium]